MQVFAYYQPVVSARSRFFTHRATVHDTGSTIITDVCNHIQAIVFTIYRKNRREVTGIRIKAVIIVNLEKDMERRLQQAALSSQLIQ
jgi:hypothetical protein